MATQITLDTLEYSFKNKFASKAVCQAFNAPAILVEKLKNLEKGKGHERKVNLVPRP